MFNRKEYQHEWYIKNKEKQLAYLKVYHQEHSAETVERVRQWRKNNPEKLKIQSDLFYKRNKEKVLIRLKTRSLIDIPEGQICQICNKVPAVQRHHPDYSKPLEVIFTCVRCNSKETFL